MAKGTTIRLFRGNKADLPILLAGEVAITTDTKELFYSADGLVNIKAGPFYSDGDYLHHQTSASTTWTINHNLDQKLCIVTITDDSDNLIEPLNVQFVSVNQLVITFSTAVSGWALISRGTTFGDYGDKLDGSDFVTGNILPDVTAIRDLGSETKTYNNIYCEHLHVSGSSLYVNGKQVISDVSDTITVSTDEDQDLKLVTTGLGDINIISEHNITLQANQGFDFTIPNTVNNKHGNFVNNSLGGNFIFTANDKVVFNAPTIDVNGNIDMGNFQIRNLPTPLNSDEPATKGYVDAQGGGGGGVAFTVTTTIVDATVSNGDIVLANSTINGTITITLTTAANAVIEVKNIGTGVVTVVGSSGLIDGEDEFVIDTMYDAFKFVCDGTNWYIF